MADFSQIHKKLKDLEKYLSNDLPKKIGIEAVNHFKKSFQDQGFTDKSLEKWDDVKRRDASSSWYGFQYRAKSSRPGSTRRKEGSTTNYSPAATKRPILTGETGQLKDSIDWLAVGRRIEITASTAYSKIQNEGGDIKVFGKASGQITARKFMGDSEALRQRINKIIENDLNMILK